ncbi:adenosylcobinamide-GDP ribazoletransferase [Alkalihalophilus lindianensis]|uniref:Adenosylcobinamide-GDP ribazoletransferase n=1 Tax=Alkalihalophilus lindianensis TaxID=1630542 RepID=A0ABU3X680_9BACI|nr:adenosylcobinamide-GDP ribazoletransferase [Alkalihalophilus lindianensis]MDV2683404.1 adenosylcobinamide-GDP ribazoletransferase [Alkalihalophilus lindianensis]
MLIEFIKNSVKGCLLAFQLLTSIPIRVQLGWNENLAKFSVGFYPFTGLVLGGLLSMQAYVLLNFTSISVLMITAWLITFTFIYSGGLHLDGWADFSDAIFSRQSLERKLEIMKDSRVGAFGVLSLLVLIGWKFLFVYEILQSPLNLFWFLLVPFLSRLVMGGLIVVGKFARNEGMAIALKPAQTTSVKWVYTLWIVATFVVAWMNDSASFIIIMLAGFFFISWLIFSYKQIKGITGDTVGAGTEGSETFLWGMIWMLSSFGMV